MKFKRILIVDDSPTVCEFLSRGVTEKNYQTLQVVRMEDALRYGGEIVDLILTDIFMPGEGGLAVIETIRKNWPNIRIIAVSGGWKDEMQGEKTLTPAEMIGADAALKKTFTPQELFEVVDRVLARDTDADKTAASA